MPLRPQVKSLRYAVKAEVSPDGEPSITITTSAPDRSNDRVMPRGGNLTNYLKNPVVMYGHDYHAIPVGRATTLRTTDEGIRASWVWLENDPFADRVKNAWNQGVLNAASIGFQPSETEYDAERQGYDYTSWELLEFSIVPIPANAQAVRSLGLPTDGIEIEDVFRFEKMVPKAGTGSGILASKALTASGNQSAGERDPIRWNPALSKAFDVTREQFKADNAEIALMARFCDCEVKDLATNSFSIMSARMGSFLAALDEHLAAVKTVEARNLKHYRDGESREAPLVYELIQLNSKRSGDYLIEGTRFLHLGETPATLTVSPSWFGLRVDYAAKRCQQSAIQKFISGVLQKASQLKFLKGEAFALSGEFLDRTSERFDDVFLEKKNIDAIRRTVKLLNDSGATMDNRGLLMLGPPGTGKTLSLRILRNEAKATFIWVSARDFYRLGSIGGLTEAFDLARENAPSILAFEDVDNWISSHSTDLLKTEMDGVAQSKGVVTILTTNYPELFPKALIDRPGRFHDVLKFDVPSDAVRTAMLRKWLPELSDAQRSKAVKATNGFSGAHVRELARFVGIIREQESLGVGAALDAALTKLAEQRELINDAHLSGSRYKAPDFVRTKEADMDGDTPATPGLMPVPVVIVDPQDDDDDDGLETPAEHAASEAAELVEYTAIQNTFKLIGTVLDQANEQVSELIAAETESPTTTPEDEDAEEILENARLSTMLALLQQAHGLLKAACGLVCSALAANQDEDDPDDWDALTSQAMELLQYRSKSGARHSAADMKMLQGMHDLAVKLGAVCGKSEPKPTESPNEAPPGEADDEPAKSLEVKGAIPVAHTATDDGAWDGPAAEARIPNDAKAATLRKAYAWVDGSKDPDTKSAYKFIHHEVGADGKIGAANIKACVTAIGVLNGGRGGTTIPASDRKGVWSHVAAHLKDAGKDVPDLKAIDASDDEGVLELIEADLDVDVISEVDLREALQATIKETVGKIVKDAAQAATLHALGRVD